MAENPMVADMGSASVPPSGEGCELDKMGAQKISVSEETNSWKFSDVKSDSFVVDMERFSHLTEKDMAANSRITLQRSLSRKGQGRGGEKKTNSAGTSERDNGVVTASSPRGGGSTPDQKPMVVTMGSTDQPLSPHLHHQITIVTSNIGTPNPNPTTVESRLAGKRFSFRRPPPSWSINPRRILLFFATLSSMGTILLIYFTLSMGKLNREDSTQNW